MSSNNHKNSDCGFAELLVSYLYDEIESGEKTVFETHLKNCLSCADELAAFEGVHFSIGEWKTQAFSKLDAPLIEIPSEKKELATQTKAIAGISRSWLDNLRDLITLAPAFSTTGAVFGALLIFAALAFVGLRSTGSLDVVQSNRESAPDTTLSIVSTDPTQNVADNSNRKSSQKKDEKKRNQPDLIVSPPNKPEMPAVKTTVNPRSTPKTDNSNKSKNNRTNDKNNDSRQKAPSLSPFEDEEDETLRLADLFSEIDAE